MSGTPLPRFSLFAPPYCAYLPFDPQEGFPSKPEVIRGAALVWCMGEGHGPRSLAAAADRPGGVPLILLLPPAGQLRRLRPRILEAVEEARPHSILPHHPRPDPEETLHLLRSAPDAPASELIDYLRWRGVHLDRETRRIVTRIVELSTHVSSLTAVARGVYLSRRALGRRFRDRGLPVPSHWLQFARILRATIALQGSGASLFDVARSIGYPDGFTLSNQMDRLLGVRPSLIRERLGWEWVAEAWLLQERQSGGLAMALRGEVGSREVREREGHAAARIGAPPGDPDAPLQDRAERVSGNQRSGAAA